MFNVRLEDDSKFDLPMSSIIILEESEEGKKATILYDIGNGRQFDKLKDNYGFIRKAMLDNGHFRDLIEVTTTRPDLGEKETRRISFESHRIKARRELKDAEDGANCLISVDIGNTLIQLRVLETRDSLAGED